MISRGETINYECLKHVSSCFVNSVSAIWGRLYLTGTLQPDLNGEVSKTVDWGAWAESLVSQNATPLLQESGGLSIGIIG